MIKPGKRGARIAAVAVAATLVPAATAYAVSITAGPGASATGFASPTTTITPGVRPAFNNNDPGISHNVRSRGTIGGGPLFLTPTITGPAQTLVNGTQYLPEGSYPFFCSVHPNMEATLNVTGPGTPVARPDIEVSIVTRTLARIRRRDRILVKVTALTKSDDVSLVLRLRKRVLGRKANLDLEAGSVRRVPIVLSNANRNRFDNLERAKLRLVGRVPFGAPDSQQKILE